MQSTQQDGVYKNKIDTILSMFVVFNVLLLLY
jgi:hypothetical protein